MCGGGGGGGGGGGARFDQITVLTLPVRRQVRSNSVDPDQTSI